MANSIIDILVTIQNGVTAISNFGKQFNGSLLNISSQLSNIFIQLGLRFATVKVQKFTGNGTYTPTTGMLYCVIECVGGGGGGGAAVGTVGDNFGGGGGASGGYARLTASAATIGASKVVTVGAGGAGGVAGTNNGSVGSDTSVDAICIAKGGGGGLYGASPQFPTGGAGVAGGTGDLAVLGGSGGSGCYALNTTSFTASNVGGQSVFGPGATATIFVGSSTVTGTAAIANTGGGGSGGTAANVAANAAGGVGGSGIVIITEFCNT